MPPIPHVGSIFPPHKATQSSRKSHLPLLTRRTRTALSAYFLFTFVYIKTLTSTIKIQCKPLFILSILVHLRQLRCLIGGCRHMPLSFKLSAYANIFLYFLSCRTEMPTFSLCCFYLIPNVSVTASYSLHNLTDIS